MSILTRYAVLFCAALTATVVTGCGAEPDTVYSSNSKLSELSIRSSVVYVKESSTSPSTFVRINQDGTATEIVRGSENLGAGPIADANDLYWLDFHRNVCTKPIQATANVTATCAALGSVEQHSPLPKEYVQMTPKEFKDFIAGKSSNSAVMQLVGTASAMYWVDMHSPEMDGLLISGSAKGAKPQFLAHGYLLRTLATDSDTVYWVTSVKDGGDEVHSMRTDGSAAQTVWKGNVYGNLASDGTYVYFSSTPSAMKLRKSDQVASVLYNTGTAVEKHKPAVLAIDQSNIYIGFEDDTHPGDSYSGDSLIFKVPKSGGKRTKVASFQEAVSDLVVDSGQLYWVSCTGFLGPCQIMKTASN